MNFEDNIKSLRTSIVLPNIKLLETGKYIYVPRYGTMGSVNVINENTLREFYQVCDSAGIKRFFHLSESLDEERYFCKSSNVDDLFECATKYIARMNENEILELKREAKEIEELLEKKIDYEKIKNLLKLDNEDDFKFFEKILKQVEKNIDLLNLLENKEFFHKESKKFYYENTYLNYSKESYEKKVKEIDKKADEVLDKVLEKGYIKTFEKNFDLLFTECLKIKNVSLVEKIEVAKSFKIDTDD